ncbi:Agrin [Halotydeus destructor]|nr:Agrin [Halotydeus destructor]
MPSDFGDSELHRLDGHSLCTMSSPVYLDKERLEASPVRRETDTVSVGTAASSVPSAGRTYVALQLDGHSRPDVASTSFVTVTTKVPPGLDSSVNGTLATNAGPLVRDNKSYWTDSRQRKSLCLIVLLVLSGMAILLVVFFATAVCTQVCLRAQEPVCGSNGQSYNSECDLQMDSCRTKSNVTVEHLGPCDLCLKITCKFGAICDKGICICFQDCRYEPLEPICASDGANYHNECHMRQVACVYEKHIEVAFYGQCEDSVTKALDVVTLPSSALDDEYYLTFTSGHSDEMDATNQVTRGQGIGYSVVDMVTSRSLDDDYHLTSTASGKLDAVITVTQGQAVSPFDAISPPSNNGADNNDLLLSFCGQFKCDFGGECSIDGFGLPFCNCNFQCDAKFHGLGIAANTQRKFIFVSSYFHQVCGTDGQLYENECALKEQACRIQRDIGVQADKFCDPSLKALEQQRSNNALKSIDFLTCTKSEFGCCIDGTTTAPAPRYAGCPETCSCYKHGSHGSTCHPVTKQCSCKPGTGGLKCDRCEAGFWGLHKIPEGNDGCLGCECNPSGSVRADCEQTTGKCVCKPGVRGIKCQHCPPGTVLSPRGCAHGKVAQHVHGRSCKELQCQHSAECVETMDGSQCICDNLCAKLSSAYALSSNITSSSASQIKLSYHPVCGSDGESYVNECQLREFSCRYQRSIDIVHDGPC